MSPLRYGVVCALLLPAASMGCSNASTGKTYLSAEAVVVLQINGTDDPARDDFTIVSLASQPRPAAKLTVELRVSGGGTTPGFVHLTAAGDGGITFSQTALTVTPGQPTVVDVFGDSASTRLDSTSIEARFAPGGPLISSEDLTVIDKVGIEFEGSFQCRLATDSANSADPTGVTPEDANAGLPPRSGWTYAYTPDEPPLDRIIRFSSPVAYRGPPGPVFEPVVVTRIIASSPPNVSFLAGDSAIGQPVNLGANSIFDGKPTAAEPHGSIVPGREPIENFEILVGSLLSGKSTTPPAGRGSVPGVPDHATITMRETELFTAISNLTPPRNSTAQGRILLARLGHLRVHRGFWAAVLSYTDQFNGMVDDSISVTPGTSSVMQIFKAKSTAGYNLRIIFYRFDADLLTGRVLGRLEVQ